MLDRYKKPGGFSQLLSLIETFNSAKQVKFLDLIQAENPAWAKALKEKILTMDRILSWPEGTIAEIVPAVPLKVLGIALHGFKPEQVEKIFKSLPHSDRRKIETESEASTPNAGEIASTHVKLIETVRNMISQGELRIEKVDANLIIDEKFEETLMQNLVFLKGDHEKTQEDSSSSEPEPKLEFNKVVDAKNAADVKAMQTLLLNLQRENKTLKGEVKMLKDKLDQIRKIA